MNTPDNRDTQWASPVKTLTIERFQPDATGTLRGWDTADEYLIREALVALENSERHTSARTVAIINDDFGALTTAFAHLGPYQVDLTTVHVIADSSISQEAINANLQANPQANLRANPGTHLSADEDSVANRQSTPAIIHITASLDALPAQSQIDLALIKVPKSIAAFEEQLRQLRPRLSDNSMILVAGMVKHLLPATQALLEKIIGTTKRHLAVKKARLFTAELNSALAPGKNQFPCKLQIESLNLSISSDAGVFSARKIDPATLFLCEHLPDTVVGSAAGDNLFIMDLGCGSGLLGLAAGQKYSGSKLCFVDCSAAAIRNAEHNVRQIIPETDALFLHQHRLNPWPHDPLDLILCNPPFHQKHTLTLDLSLQMFADAHRVMRAGAEFLVVSNRHLPYENPLQRLFGNHRDVAQNNKFKIHRVIKRG